MSALWNGLPAIFHGFHRHDFSCEMPGSPGCLFSFPLVMARLVLHSMWIDFICEHTLYLNQDSQLNIINPKIYTHMLAGSSIRHSQLAKYE